MHLLALWNPSYADDPLEAHLAVLLDRVRQWRAHTIADDEVAVWWGLTLRCAQGDRPSLRSGGQPRSGDESDHQASDGAAGG